LKIPEDTPIESGLVSRSLVEAQRKIEGFNFDARKHLLDYDDILNKQRLAIYRKRQEILEADKDKFVEILRRSIDSRSEKMTGEEKEKNDPEKIKEKIAGLAGIEWIKGPILGILDMLWMNHLEDLETLNESVRIRAYGQHDPLVEYRREGHILYNNLHDNFDALIFENMSRIQSIDVKPEQESKKNGLPPLNISANDLAKVGRNDPCPCGSGKKFKKCHGA
jgi:preprotein translocase subunit SecA